MLKEGCHCEEERRSNLKTGIASLSPAMMFKVNLFNTLLLYKFLWFWRAIPFDDRYAIRKYADKCRIKIKKNVKQSRMFVAWQ